MILVPDDGVEERRVTPGNWVGAGWTKYGRGEDIRSYVPGKSAELWEIFGMNARCVILGNVEENR